MITLTSSHLSPRLIETPRELVLPTSQNQQLPYLLYKVAQATYYHLEQGTFPKDRWQYLQSACNFVAVKREGLPRASTGKTPVFLPNEFPNLVIKCPSDFASAKSRFQIMQKIQHILSKQKSTHLIIPKAFLQEKYQLTYGLGVGSTSYLVEERLPISENPFRNIEIYLQYRESFNDSVREMTRFFKTFSFVGMICFRDLLPLRVTQEDLLILGSIGNAFMRYDNYPLFLKRGNDHSLSGCIGLIDTERFEVSQSNEGFLTLAFFFPYHLNIIVDELEKLGGKINTQMHQQMCAFQQAGDRFIQNGYVEFANWLREKGVSLETPNHFPFIEDRELIDVCAEKLNQELPELAIEELRNKIIPIFLQAFVKQCTETLSKKATLLTTADLVQHRSLLLSRIALRQQFIKTVKELASFTVSLSLYDTIFLMVLEELKHQNYLFDFNRGNYTGVHKKYIVRV